MSVQLNDQEIYEALRDRELILLGVEEDYPFTLEQIQPASVDLRLGNRFVRFKTEVEGVDTRKIQQDPRYLEGLTEVFFRAPDEPLTIGPHEVIYAQVYEMMSIGERFSARIEGRSRAARLGISVHCTGPYINPGYTGAMPLQLINHNRFPVVLYPYMGICQLIVCRLTARPLRRYGEGNTYQGEEEPRLSALAPPQPLTNLQRIQREKINRLWQQYAEDHRHSPASRMADPEQLLLQVQNFGTLNYTQRSGRVSNYCANQAGNMGDRAGEHAAIHFHAAPEGGQDLQAMLEELRQLRGYLRKQGTEEADALLGQAAELGQALEKGEERRLAGLLKTCGKKLLSLAGQVGCEVLKSYLTAQLGIAP